MTEITGTITPKYPNTLKAELLDGKGACPPEDCGGIWGYEELKNNMTDPSHEEYEELCVWLDLKEGENWNPKNFDLNTCKANVAAV